MKVLSLLASLLLAGGTTPDATQQNNTHGSFRVVHEAGNGGPTLSKCAYPDAKCLLMNLDRFAHPVDLVFRIEPLNANLADAVAEAEYVAWIQRNDNACHYAEGDAQVFRLGKAPLGQPHNIDSVANSHGVKFGSTRLEINSSHIMELAREQPVGVSTWQICVGIDPKHGVTVESGKHPVGSLTFSISTKKPDAPLLSGVKGSHERLTATVLLAPAWRERTAAVGVRAIPTQLATLTQSSDHDGNNDPNQRPPMPSYACPADNGDYQGFALGGDAKTEINPREAKYTSYIDKDDKMMHLPITLSTIPDQSYVVCAYTRDLVNNKSDYSAPNVGKSYRATDLFAAIPKDVGMNMGHGCSDIGLTPLSCAAAACAWAAVRLRRRWRKTPR